MSRRCWNISHKFVWFGLFHSFHFSLRNHPKDETDQTILKVTATFADGPVQNKPWPVMRKTAITDLFVCIMTSVHHFYPFFYFRFTLWVVFPIKPLILLRSVWPLVCWFVYSALQVNNRMYLWVGRDLYFQSEQSLLFFVFIRVQVSFQTNQCISNVWVGLFGPDLSAFSLIASYI